MITESTLEVTKIFIIQIKFKRHEIFRNSFLESVWYLSSNGYNNTTCGQNRSNACRTFEWLLRRFYNTLHNRSKTLCIVTDISLLVDDTLVVSFAI